MIELIDAFSRHLRRNRVKYLLALLLTATATASYLYVNGNNGPAISRRARRIERSLADC